MHSRSSSPAIWSGFTALINHVPPFAVILEVVSILQEHLLTLNMLEVKCYNKKKCTNIYTSYDLLHLL